MKRTKRIGLFGAAAALLALSGLSSAQNGTDVSLEIPEIIAQSDSNVVIPIYATADSVMSATLVFTFDPSLFVDGIDGITVSAPTWSTQNPIVEPEGTPPGENLYDNVFVDYNIDVDHLIVAIASSDPRSFYDSPLITISGQLIANHPDGYMNLSWSAADVEINGEPITVLTNGFLDINDPPYWSMVSSGTAIEGISMDPIAVLAVDPDDDPLTYEIVTGPAWVTLVNDELTGTPNDTDIGNNEVTLSVTDSVSTVELVFTIEVAENQPPVWVSPVDAIQAVEYQEFSRQLVATDFEEQPLTFSISAWDSEMQQEQWVTLDGRTLSGVPEGDDIDDLAAVDITVSDGVKTTTVSVKLDVLLYFGDVTLNGGISALDASKILKYVVKKIETIDTDRADVSREEFSQVSSVDSWDAALILYKVVNPSYLFPVQGGESPIGQQQVTTKLAFAPPASLEWTRTGDSWSLSASGVGPIGADIVLRMPESASLASDIAFDYMRDGDMVTIAAAAIEGSELFRVNGMSDAPEVVSAKLNGAEAMVAVPMSFDLHQNTPNPFNPSTTITFSLPESAPVTLAIYDVNGRMVRTLVSGERAAGLHEVVWNGMDDNGRAVASGVYVYRLTAGEKIATQRLALIR